MYLIINIHTKYPLTYHTYIVYVCVCAFVFTCIVSIANDAMCCYYMYGRTDSLVFVC